MKDVNQDFGIVEPTGSYSNAGDAIVRSSLLDKLKELISGFTDKAFDAVDHTEFLEGIPIVSWLYKTTKAARSLKEMVLIKKVAKFLEGVGEIPNAEREEFLRKMDLDPEYQRDIGESLILLLERHDNFEKSLMLGTVYAALVRGKIERDDFDLISDTIDRANVVDLKSMYQRKEDSEWSRRDRDREVRLYQAGLYKMEVELGEGNLRAGGLDSHSIKVGYDRNDVGDLFVEIMTGRIYNEKYGLF